MKPFIPSLMDTDYYTLTMAQLVYHNFPGKNARYTYKCRNGTGFPEGMSFEHKKIFVDLMNKELDYFCDLQFTVEEVGYLRLKGHFQEDFLNFIANLKLNRNHIRCWLDKGRLHIAIEGPIEQTIWFETAVLAINSEMCARSHYVQAYEDLRTHSMIRTMSGGKIYDEELEVARKRLSDKLYQIEKADISGFNIIDFGTRRRFSFEWHDEVIKELKSRIPHVLKGTSNCYFAMKHDIPMIGTMAHQVFQMYQQITDVASSQVSALEAWRNEYGNDLQVALSDIFGFNAFLEDFKVGFNSRNRSFDFPSTYSGVRHDSGNPYIWCENLLNFYNGMGIDARTKTAVFSDGLTVKKALNLFATFNERIKVFNAIGTNLTNDTTTKALQIVIKLVEFDYGPTAKIADTPGKGMCEDGEFEEYVTNIADIKAARYVKWAEKNTYAF